MLAADLRGDSSATRTARVGAPASDRRLRILFLASRDVRHPENTGGDLTLWHCARYMASRGHGVTYMACRFPGAQGDEFIDGIHVVRRGHLLSLWFHSFTYYFSHCRGRFDVVIVEGFGGSRIPRLAPLYVREPVITEWHQLHGALFRAQYPRALVPALDLLERATAVAHWNTLLMARTDEGAQAFLQLGFRRANIRVVPVSIDEDSIATESRPPPGPHFVWIGKFRRYKCPDHVVSAMTAVLERCPGAKLTLAGYHDDLRYEKDLVHLAAAQGLQEHVTFRFAVTEAEKRELLDSARALIVTSAVEGFGIAVLEANARGAPVIASSGVPSEAVRDGYNGLRYSFGDQAQLALHMCRLAQDDDLWRTLSATCRQFAGRFGWADVGARYERVIRETVASSATRREVTV